MQAVFTILFPVFALVFIGYLFGKIELLGQNNARALNDYVYYISLPVLLFYETHNTHVTELFHYSFTLTVILSSFLVMAASFLIGKYYFRHNAFVATAYGFSATFPNSAFMGIPLFISAFGKEGALPAVLMAIIGNTIVIGSVVILFETFAKAMVSIPSALGHSFLALIKNPLVSSSLLGVFFSVSEIELPMYLDNLLQMISHSAAPVALISIGLSFIGLSINIRVSELVSLTLIKLVLYPFVTYLFVTFIFTMDEHWAESAILLSALPNGALVYVLCQKYDVYVQESSSVFMATTLLSMLSLPFLLYLFI